MSVKIMYYVHGTTTDNANKLCSGWKEAMLNDLGKEQAMNLGNISREREDNFDIIFTSDLKRAIESSNIAFPEMNKITDNRLRECNYGDLDGCHKSLVVYEEHVDEVKQIVEKNPRITLWSSRSSAVFRYLRKTEPEFSISKEASILIDEAVSKKYPEIWELFDEY